MENTITIEQCKLSTIEHIENVRKFMKIITDELVNRAIEHDKTKLESPEVEIFTEYTPKLANTTYGSEEYNTYLKEMNVALQHHYNVNRHHPEHFENSINDMNLVDLIEMICDWKAATLRHNNGDLVRSIDFNATRFKYGEQLKQIFMNTAQLFIDKEQENN